MTRWDTFRLLAECLRPALDQARPSIPPATIAWAHVVEASSEHLVAPALGWSLRGDERVPSEVFACFETLLALNRARNGVMLGALQRLVTSLNRAGIRPVLLKGAAALVDDLYPDPGMRVLGDIDLLLPKDALADGVAATYDAGFLATNRRVRFDADVHHLPSLVQTETDVSVELHMAPVPARFETLVDTERCLHDGIPIRWRGLDAIIPDPTERVAHNVTHGQIVDEHYWRGIPRFRQLLDLALLRTRHADTIAWHELERRFARAGFGHVLADTLAISEELLERPGAPQRSAALERLEATVNEPHRKRWAIYWRAALRNSRRLVHNPGFLRHALDPRFWQAERHGIVRRLRTTRW
jgi:hypothetical protein